MKRYITILTVLLLSVYAAVAQVKMRLEAPATVDLGEEYFQIMFKIDAANVSNFNPPSLEGFELLSGPVSSFRSNTSVINGKVKHEEQTTFTYVLAPKRKGTFTIGEATAVADGRTVRSSAKTIQVTGDGKSRSQKSAGGGRSGASSAGGHVGGKDLFIEVSANRRKIYEQDPVLLVYKFYARPEVMLNQIGIQKKPDFKGMLSQDIPVDNIYMNVENIGGVSYRSGVIQKYVIFPQSAGKITVPGVVFNCDVMQRDATIDPLEAFFNGGGTISKTVQRKVEDVQLDILPLPQPKPKGFSGGVGQFTIKGEVLTPEFRTNDVVTYRVTIEGTGNLKLLTAPQLELSGDFDAYAPKVTEETEVTERGMSGRMIYEYTFVPRKVGDYELPAVTLNYFDPSAEQYKTVATEAVPMHVEKGSRTNEEYQRTQQIRQRDIRDIHSSGAALSARDDLFWWGKPTYWLVYLLIVAVAAAAFRMAGSLAQANADVVSRKSRKAAKMATRRMTKAKAFMEKGDRAAFYAEVSHALNDYAADKYNIPQADMKRARIEAELAGRQVPEAAAHRFLHLLDECDFAQYAPSSQVMGMQEMYEAAVAAIIEIEKQK